MSKNKQDAVFLPPSHAAAGSRIAITHPLIGDPADGASGFLFDKIDVLFESREGNTATVVLPDEPAGYIVSVKFRSTRDPEEIGRYIVDPKK